jgi:hypothetical protein
MFMHLQQGIRKGNTRAVEVAIKVLDHKAKINGYRSYGSEPEIAVQAGIEPPKSRAELEAEGAQYIDLFRGAVQILVDLYRYRSLTVRQSKRQPARCKRRQDVETQTIPELSDYYLNYGTLCWNSVAASVYS